MDLPTPKVLLLGWDAADWKVIRPLIEEGSMPNLARMMASGVHGNIATIYPALSPTLWTSISTGKRPPKHGVLGFSEPTPDGRGVRPCSILSRNTKAIWNILAQNGKRSVVVGWWPSHPAEPIPGAMVSNHFQDVPNDPDADLPPLVPGTVSPPRLAEEISDLRVMPHEIPGEVLRMFAPRWEEVDQENDKSLHDLASILAETLSIHAAATDLLERESWDFAAVYFDTIDHASHRFMRYHPPRQDRVPEAEFDLYRDIVANVYRHHDAMLGRYLELAGPHAHVIVMSDHGFHSDSLRPAWIPAEPAGPAVEHRHFGIFVMSGPRIRRGERVFGCSILDICPTLLTLFGLAVGEDMDGNSQRQIFETEPEVVRIPSWDSVRGEDGRHPPETEQDPRASSAALEQMVALGYIAPLPENAADAVRETVRELDYNLARALLDGGNPRDAIPLFEKLWGDWPREHRFGLHLIHSLTRCGHVEKCRTAFETLKQRATHFAREATLELEALALEPPTEKNDSPAKAREEGHRRDYQRRQLLELAAGMPQGLLREEINLLFLENRTGEAAQRLEALLSCESLTLPLLAFAAEALAKTGRAEDDQRALVLLDALQTNVPDESFAPALRAELAYRRKDWNTVIDSAAVSLGLIYFNPRLHALLGMALLQTGRFEDANNELLVAVRQNPGQPDALEALAFLHRDDGDKAVLFHGLLERTRQLQTSRRKLQAADPVPDPLPNYAFSSLCSAPASRAAIPVGQPLPPILVSGLPRSGTSMLMRILQAGGIPILTDAERAADENNRLGYFEYAPVKLSAQDVSWLPEARGKAVKVVAPLLRYLPPRAPLRLLVMHRPLSQILASQNAMIGRLEKETSSSASAARQFALLMETLPSFLEKRPQWQVLHISYEEVLASPQTQCLRIADFLGSAFDPIPAANAVDASQRRFSGQG